MFPSSTVGKRLSVTPVSDIHELQIYFPLPAAITGPSFYRSDAGSFLASLVGDESQGSLLSLLKQQGLAEAVNAGVDPNMEGFALFSCRYCTESQPA